MSKGGTPGAEKLPGLSQARGATATSLAETLQRLAGQNTPSLGFNPSSSGMNPLMLLGRR